MTPQEKDALATEYLAKEDYENAMKYFLQASEEGYYISTYNIACMYYFGDGVEQNEAKAFEWYKKAAAQGDPEAANRAAIMRVSQRGSAPSSKPWITSSGSCLYSRATPLYDFSPRKTAP